MTNQRYVPGGNDEHLWAIADGNLAECQEQKAELLKALERISWMDPYDPPEDNLTNAGLVARAAIAKYEEDA